MIKTLILMVSMLCGSAITRGQGNEYRAVIPFFLPRDAQNTTPSSLQLKKQRFILFQYQNAVAVYSEALFSNESDESLNVEIGLPSTGFRPLQPEDDSIVSNGLLGVRIWVDGERRETRIDTDDTIEWFTITPLFRPHEETTVKSMFWVQTSLANVDSLPGYDTIPIPRGPRFFMIDLAGSAVWREAINELHVVLVLKDGLALRDAGFSAEPRTYEARISDLIWTSEDVEPTVGDAISVRYSARKATSFTTMGKAAEFITRRVYDDLEEYSRP